MVPLIGAWTNGLILGLLALGIYLSYRVFRFADITVDGSMTLGAALTASLVTNAGLDPFVATPLAFLAGMLAGATTGVLHTRFKINPLLSGILVMTALYSINLRIMGKSNVTLQTTLVTYAGQWGAWVTGAEKVALLGWQVPVADLSQLILILVFAILVGLIMNAFLRSDLGTAMRATGDNDQMIRALGVNVDAMIVTGLALANGLAALAGALYAQYQGFADIQTGIGMILVGLASVIIGEALVGGGQHVGLAIAGTLMGSLFFSLLEALCLRCGLDTNDLKLTRSVFVFFALIAPGVLGRWRAAFRRRRAAMG
jgi:putative tryptophan/tyrosine transport system permease protein